MSSTSNHFDAIIIGSGPGGATLARQLTLAGQNVLLLERGRSLQVRDPLRDIIACAKISHLGRGATLVSGRAVGGSTMLYYGTAHLPPLDRFHCLGVELAAAVEQCKTLLSIAPLRDDLIGPMARQISQSARDLGYAWQKLAKLTVPSIAAGSRTIVNEQHWLARRFVEDAISQGANFCARATAEQILVDSGRVSGVVYRQTGNRLTAFAERVILAAGGVESPRLLQRLGLKLEAGFFCDPIMMVFAEHSQQDAGVEAPMACGMHLEEQGLMLADLRLPKVLFTVGALQALRPLRMLGYGKHLGIMVKAADETGGNLLPKPRKIFSAEDFTRLNNGAEIAERILRHAGGGRIFCSGITSAHPGGAVQIGRQLDSDLQTQIKNLYVCDGSVLPAPWGLPPTLSIICLALRLARHLTDQS